MRYLLVLLAYVGTAHFADAQVVVKPEQRPIYIHIESEDKQPTEVAASKVDEVDVLKAEITELRKEIEFLRAAKQVELFAVDPPSVVEETKTPKFAPYPTRPARRSWNMGRISQTNSNLIRHLMGEIGSPQHRGRFNRDYLNYLATLPDGNARLRALHSDDHDHVVRWDYLDGKPKASLPTTSTVICPSGNCPNIRFVR